MIVFKYEVKTVKDCHLILDGMNIPGEKHESEPLDEHGSKIVWKGDKFIGLLHPDSGKMELYPTKNTNSINYFIHRYQDLDWDTWALVKTKRW